ncbi:MAG: fumarate hydratase [Firmicutes bacterium]|nr:fumarate hydratase [Bacillota bacterium]
MTEIHVDQIIDEVRRMCIEANVNLPPDVCRALEKAVESEGNPTASSVLELLLENADIARNECIPICQDTGMAVFFVEVGQDCRIVGGGLTDAINDGVMQGYQAGYLRKSIVSDPLERLNTNDNTPAVIYYDIVPGEALVIHFSPKGFGSENMSQLKMLAPAEGVEGVKSFVVQVVREAGPNPCPPVVLGVGIGGTMDKAAVLAKKALFRPIGKRHPDPRIARLEEELLELINDLDIGPQGFGGRTTALGVSIETFPTHIAGLPVAVNVSCHVTRHLTTRLGR